MPLVTDCCCLKSRVETTIPMFHLEQSQLRQMVICSWARSQFFVSGWLCKKTGSHIGCLCICQLPLPIPSQGSNNWLPGCAIILHLCVVYPGSNLAWILIPEWWLLQQFLPLTLKHLFRQGISVWYPSFHLNNSATVMIANSCFRKIKSFQMLENDMNPGCPWWLDLHSEITESDHAVSPLIPGHWDVPKPLFNLDLVSSSAAQREI